jgi:hypothetical protein
VIGTIRKREAEEALSKAKMNQAKQIEERVKSYEEKKPTSKESNYDKVSKVFKNGNIYFGAECFLNRESIAFQRGMTHYQLAFKENGFIPQLLNILRKLGIERAWTEAGM